MNKIEEERMAELNRARFKGGVKPDLVDTISRSAVSSAAGGGGGAFKALVEPERETKLSFGEKVSREWFILGVAAVFDILAMIPIVSVVFNFLFGLILYLYFGPKRKGKKGSEFSRIGVPMMAGSVVDFFVGIFPVNIGTTLIRIWFV